MGALRVVLGSLLTALRCPRVLAVLWLCVTVPALVAVVPVASELDSALARHPGASLLLDQVLDGDFARRHPRLTVSLGGGALAVALLFAWLAGGILTRVERGQRLRLAELFADGARLLPRTLRALLVLAVAALLLTWGIEAFDRQVREAWLYDTDTGATSVPGITGPWLSLEAALDGLRWLYGLLVVALLLIGKVALALLATGQRRSATLALLHAAWLCARRPLRSVALVVLLAGAWLGGSHAIGMVTVLLLEIRGQPWLGLLSGQLGCLWSQAVVVAALLAARDLARPAPAPVQAPRTP